MLPDEQCDNSSEREVGGLLGRVAAYSGVIQDQRRGALHLHCMVWMQSHSNVVTRVLELAGAGDAEEAKAEMKVLTERIKECIVAHLSTGIDLPAPEQDRLRTCPDDSCRGVLLGPDDHTLGNLRRFNVQRAPDPKVLRCGKCAKYFGCKEVQLGAIAAALKRLGLDAMPETGRACTEMLNKIKYNMQRSADAYVYGSETYKAYMALVQLNVNSHDANHTFTCKKKGGMVCRFKIPYLFGEQTSVNVEKEDKSHEHFIMVKEHRDPSAIYTATFNTFLSRIGLCNTNFAFVRSQQLGFYIAAYMSKYCAENAEAQAALEQAFIRIDIQQQEEDRQRQARARQQSTHTTPSAAACSCQPASSLSDSMADVVDLTVDSFAEDVKHQNATSASRAPRSDAGACPVHSSPCASQPHSVTSKDPSSVPDEPLSDYALGRRKVLSAIFHASNKSSVAAQIASFRNLGNDLFFFSHYFCTLPYKQGLAFIKGDAISCNLTKLNELSASVLDYAFRSKDLEKLSWYFFVAQYRLSEKKKSKKSTTDDGL